MTLRLSNLSVLAYANNFTLWHFKTKQESILNSNYFDPAANIMNVGDMIIANVDTEGEAKTHLYVVSDISNGVVAIKSF